MAFAGPVSTSYEFAMDTRVTDHEWKQALSEKRAAQAPEWTHDWLVGEAPAHLHSGGD